MGKVYGIFTKPIHVEKILNYLNQYTDIKYIISTERKEIYAYKFDIGVSYCFPWVVDINYPIRDERKWFNYHPAPLPEYPGLTNYAEPIADKVKIFGVTLHRMTEKVDEGQIVKRLDFPLNSIPINSNELGCISHYYLFQLFKKTINNLEYE
jgi:folate-dependent phosphoribosylglycinamide formyltransferase PurN